MPGLILKLKGKLAKACANLMAFSPQNKYKLHFCVLMIIEIHYSAQQYQKNILSIT